MKIRNMYGKDFQSKEGDKSCLSCLSAKADMIVMSWRNQLVKQAGKYSMCSQPKASEKQHGKS